MAWNSIHSLPHTSHNTDEYAENQDASAHCNLTDFRDI
jgi:hypothetical protein